MYKFPLSGSKAIPSGLLPTRLLYCSPISPYLIIAPDYITATKISQKGYSTTHVKTVLGHMGSLFTCKSCQYRVYLITQKEELVFPEQIRCPLCGEIREYLEYEIQQERYDLTCPVCKGRFFIRKLPPIKVICPYSSSLLYIRSDGNISIMEVGSPPATTRQGTVGGALGGMVLGGLIAGGGGALLGTLTGAVLGSAFDVKEAKYF